MTDGLVREITVTFRVYGSQTDAEALEAVAKLVETHNYRLDRTGFPIGAVIGKVARFLLRDLKATMDADREKRIASREGVTMEPEEDESQTCSDEDCLCD
jgi:hypothetical protein